LIIIIVLLSVQQWWEKKSPSLEFFGLAVETTTPSRRPQISPRKSTGPCIGIIAHLAVAEALKEKKRCFLADSDHPSCATRPTV